MTDLQKIKGFENLRKDTKNGGVLNVDVSSYEQHKRVKEQLFLKQQEATANLDMVNGLKMEVDCIKSDMTEIKNMLISIMTKGN